MPQVLSREEVVGYAHCSAIFPDPAGTGHGVLCDGNVQEQVPAIREEIGLTYNELGGDLHVIERSMVYVNFVNAEDATCPHCGGPRVISDQKRPAYPNQSRQDPNGLLKLMGLANGAVGSPAVNVQSEVAELREALEKATAEIERLGAAQTESNGASSRSTKRGRAEGDSDVITD